MAVGAVVDPQRQAQTAVGQESVPHDPGRSLRAQNKVHAEGAPSRGNVHKEAVQLGKNPEHRRELINDDDEAGKRMLQPPVRHVSRAHCTQRALTVAKFGAQTSQGSRGRRRVEVGDETNAVWQLPEGLKGCTALEIDQEKVHLVGRISCS